MAYVFCLFIVLCFSDSLHFSCRRRHNAGLQLSFYTLTQLMSPSKKILICRSRKDSVSYEALLKSIDEEDFIDTRLRRLTGSRNIIGKFLVAMKRKVQTPILKFPENVF